MSILSTCRQIYKECLPLPYKLNTFCVPVLDLRLFLGRLPDHIKSSITAIIVPDLTRWEVTEQHYAAFSIVANNQAGLIGLIELDGHVTGQSSQA
jgi:hypothetical protein